MRKLIVICGLVLMCILYFIFMKTSSVEGESKNKIDTLITNEMKGLESSYPSSPKGVIESHNKLMAYEYSKEITENDISLLIEAMRMLYTEALLDINTLESQKLSLTAEIITNKGKGIYIIDNEVGDILYEDENKVAIIVKHFTTIGDITRKYDLIKEDDRWKINRWTGY